MKTITRKYLFYLTAAILFIGIVFGVLIINNQNAFAETEDLPFTIVGITSGEEYRSGDFVNERVKIELNGGSYSKIYYKPPQAHSFTYTNSKKYTTGLINGLYTFYLATEEGEQSQEYSIYYDNNPPIGQLYSDGNCIEDNAYAYENLVYSATDDGSGVLQMFYKTPTSEAYQEYNSEIIIDKTSESGWYSFYAVDICQNISEVKSIFFKSDKNAVAGNWISLGENLSNNGYTNQPLSFEFDDKEYTAKFSHNGGDFSDYTSGQIFTEDGEYIVVLSNLVNQEYKFTAHIDTVPPTGQLYANYLPVSNNQFTQEKVYFTWDGDYSATVNGTHYLKNSVLSVDGIYHFVLVDAANNQTEYTITIDTIAPSYNLEKLNNEQKLISEWFIVRIDGTDYSFSSYNESLDFASKKEFEKQVKVFYLENVEDFNQSHLIAGGTNVHTGEYWLYKSKANPDIQLYYFDEILLKESVEFYAKDYISSKIYFEYDEKNNYGITADSMSDNWSYSVGSNPTPFVNTFVFDCVDSVELFAELADESGTRIKLDYGRAFDEQIAIGGLYKITEIDEANNINTYYCYFDTFTPTLNVGAKIYGDTEPTQLIVSKDSLQGLAAYFYESFDIKEIVDADKWTVLKIENKGRKQYFSYEDDLPCLTLGGEYLLTVYDRFDNIYSFAVYIVGNPATISFGSNSDDSMLKLSIVLEQSFDTIVSLEVRRNGQILNGVSTDKLSYEFEDGGVYTVRLQDNFGRVVISEYSFKTEVDTTAPTISFRGVENGGIADKPVTIYNLSKEAKVEVFKDGQLIEYSLGEELSEYGEYVIVLTDLAGNVSTYNFTIKHTLNAGSIVLIVFSILFLIGVIIAIILMRKVGIFGKKKTLKSDSNSLKKN